MPLKKSWHKAKEWFIHLLHLDESTHQIALGVGIGVAVAFTPTVGIQMVLVLLITTVVPGNRAAGIPMVWISNPATILPIYSFNLWLGIRMVGGSAEMMVQLRRAIGGFADAELSWWGLMERWWHLMIDEIAIPLWVGSIPVAIVTGLLGYGIMYWLVAFYRKQHRRHVAIRAAKKAQKNTDHE